MPLTRGMAMLPASLIGLKADPMTKTIDTWLRIAAWGGALLLWLVPHVAMRFTSEVNWTWTDFTVWAVMLFLACAAFEAGLRLSSSWAYRAAVVVGVGTGFLLTWGNLAVGVIGNEADPINQIFFGVLAIGAIGAFIANFRARGMALAAGAMAVAQGAIAGWALFIPGAPVALIAGFALGFALSAWLFHKAAGEGAVS